jgi:hypothetical protein
MFTLFASLLAFLRTRGLSVQPGGSALITLLLAARIPSKSATVRGVTLDAALLELRLALSPASAVWRRQGKKGEPSSFRTAEWTGHEDGEWDYDHLAAKVATAVHRASTSRRERAGGG